MIESPSPASTPRLAASPGLRRTAVHCLDVDDQAAALPGWRQHYQQLSPGPYDGHVEHVTLPDDYAFFVESCNRQLCEIVSPPPGTFAFAVRADDGPPGRLEQTPFWQDDLICLDGRHDSSVSLPPGTRLNAIVLPLSELLADPSPVPLATRDWRAGSWVARSTIVPLLRGFVDQVMQVTREHPQTLAAPQAMRALRSATVSNVWLAINGETDAPVAMESTARRRWQIVQRARAHIDAHLGDVFTVADVCKAIGVSRRTLQYCFEDVLQINPIAYVRAVRLNAVRRDLKQADPAVDTVADIAARRGFWHLGHFAADYRRMFGETPSTTLQSSRVLHRLSADDGVRR